MVTHNDNGLHFWNVSNGRRERSISCHPLGSLSFSASGNLLATIHDHTVFSVYDLMNDYQVNCRRIENAFSIVIVSTFDHNSWLCYVDFDLGLVSLDLVLSHVFYSCVRLPFPGNNLSSRELQRFLRHPEESWLSNVFARYPKSGYFLVGDKYLLLFSCDAL